MSEEYIIGVDHGYAATKTVHSSFPTGLVAYTASLSGLAVPSM